MAETAIDKKTGEYILRNPRTGKLEGYKPEEAIRLVQEGQREPVSMEEAEPFYDARASARVVGAGEGFAEGVFQGIGGGVIDMQLPEGAGQGILSVEQGAPVATGLGNVAGTIAPFVGPLKAGRLLTAPGLLEAGGTAVTTGLRKGAPGLARVALSRAAGVGTEVTGALALEEARRAHLEARPANFSRVLGGYGLGAMIPALVLGTGVGVLEGGALTLGQRQLARMKAARDVVFDPTMTATDFAQLAQREGKIAPSGLADQWHAMKMGEDPAVATLLKDGGAYGEAFRQRMLEAGDARVAAAHRLAPALNRIRDIDDILIRANTGPAKKELFEKLMADMPDADQFALRDMLRETGANGDIAEVVAHHVRNKTEFGKKVASKLAFGKGMNVRDAMKAALDSGDTVALEVATSPEMNVLMANSKSTAWRKAAKAVEAGPQWKQEVNRVLRDFEEELNLMSAEGKGYIGEQAGKIDRMIELAKGTRSHISQAKRAEGMAEFDNFKRRLSDWAEPGARLGSGQGVAEFARKYYETSRQLLENPLYWGERAATVQRETNELFAKRIARADSFHKGWFKDSGVVDPKNTWRNQVEATPDSVFNIMGDVADMNDPAIKKWREHIAETKEGVDKALRDYEHLDPATRAELVAARPAIDDAVNAFNEMIHHTSLVNVASHLGKANSGLGVGFAARAVLGHVVGGLPGALGAAYITNKLNPQASIVARAHLERVLRQNEGRIERAVARLTNNEVVPRGGLLQAGAKTIASQTPRLADASREEKQDGYQKSIKELYAAAQDPTKAREVIEKEIGAMEEHMPGLTEQATQQAVAGMRYAYDHAPAKPVMTLGDGEYISPVSDVELHVFELLYEAAMDPTSILEQAADGELTPEAVDAAEAVAPEFVAELRQEVVDQIATGAELSYEQEVALGTLLKMPVNMTMTPEYIRTQQMLYAARAQSSGPKSPRSFSETGAHKTDNMSKSDQLASGVPPS